MVCVNWIWFKRQFEKMVPKKGTQYKENHRKCRQGSMAFLPCTFFLEDKRTVRTIQAEPRYGHIMTIDN